MTGTAAEVKIPAAMSILYVPVLVLVTVTPCEANCGTICLGAPRLTRFQVALDALLSEPLARVRERESGRAYSGVTAEHWRSPSL